MGFFGGFFDLDLGGDIGWNSHGCRSKHFGCAQCGAPATAKGPVTISNLRIAPATAKRPVTILISLNGSFWKVFGFGFGWGFRLGFTWLQEQTPATAKGPVTISNLRIAPATAKGGLLVLLTIFDFTEWDFLEGFSIWIWVGI